ncbi:hypothetical protein C9374_012610 [Naegleria lovaniensis]|uniref:Ubiquitin-like domain-containing protein n=1 Tax=Naegleria lovaniensis TaxID=51637 RepID=A0AA88GWL0_NAELO|nr:uncharacterized protein C9374_012610 [Naegleria lovaniensis]KAG2392358.1 hypothetical protein C9374_012610 [Naegleria lovaniensis]
MLSLNRSCSFNQLPVEIWDIVFSFMEPVFDASKENSKSITFIQTYTRKLREWNAARSTSSIFYNVVKSSFSVLDLSPLFSTEIITIAKVSDEMNPFMPSKKQGFTWSFITDDQLEKEESVNKIFKRQDEVCKYLVRGVGNGFSSISKLVLDNMYRLQEAQLEQLCDMLPNLTHLSLLHCNNVKHFNVSKHAKISHFRIHAFQLDLRIELTRQQYSQQINRVITIEVEGGYEVFLSYLAKQLVHTVKACHRYRVGDLKKIVAPFLEKEPPSIRFIFAGTDLDDERFLPDCSISTYCTLHVVCRN